MIFNEIGADDDLIYLVQYHGRRNEKKVSAAQANKNARSVRMGETKKTGPDCSGPVTVRFV